MTDISYFSIAMNRIDRIIYCLNVLLYLRFQMSNNVGYSNVKAAVCNSIFHLQLKNHD